MTIFTYDNTLDGLLSCIFFAYENRIIPDEIIFEGEPKPLFTMQSFHINTEDKKAARVWTALEKKLSAMARKAIVAVWLSELPEREMLLFRYIKKNIDAPEGIETNFADADVLRITEITHKVSRDAQRLIQFVRFQETADGMYFAPISPIYNTLGLVVKHFRARFADRQWIIYDMHRRYGYCYDMNKVFEITFSDEDFARFADGKLNADLLSQNEQMLQTLWKEYFKTIAIKERINPRQQRQFMPRRYWKYLTEMR